MATQSIHPFAEIGALRSTRKGEEQDGLAHVQDFLDRFGYFADKSSCQTGVLDEPTSEAIEKYQRSQGLEVTGEFDEATRSQMTTTRCGLPDLQSGVAFATTCSWNQTELTYAFDTGTNDVAGDAEFQAVRNAFQTWASVIQLTFREVGEGDNPNVLIGWRPANDPDLNMQGGTLAHADFPPGCSVVTNTLPKPVHFDDTEHAWTIGAAPGAFDVESVALHEIGHILGLAHTNVSGAVMFPSISPNTTVRNLAQDDIQGIQQLYPARQTDRCFVATAAYGSEIAPEVGFLRGIRDQILRQTQWGRKWFTSFERYYYRISPPIAEKMEKDPELRSLVRWSIVEPLVNYLRLMTSLPDWEKFDFETMDPELRIFLTQLRRDSENWLSSIDLPTGFSRMEPMEAVKELNVILNFVRRTGARQYLDKLVQEGELPLGFEPEEEDRLAEVLRNSGRSAEEIERILHGR